MFVFRSVGLDVEDIDFKNNGIKVTRKGGNEMIVYFWSGGGEGIKKPIWRCAKGITPVTGHEHALFCFTQRKTYWDSGSRKSCKKYTSEITTTKENHASQAAQHLWYRAALRETGDIYLVADVLGHKDVNTTKKYYAAIDDSRRRAAGAVKLRRIKN